MTLTKMQAMLGVATGVLAFAAAVGGLTLRFTQVIERLDTRMAKLESAIKTLNASTPDERYKELVKELMAERERADAPSASHDYVRKDSTTHDFLCSHNGEAEVPCDVLYPPNAGASASSPAMVKPPQ